MTEQELSEVEARANAATPGPWGFVPPRTEELAIKGEVHCDEGPIFVAAHYDIAKSADFEFAAHAREDIPKLIAEVRRLRGLILDAERSATSFGPNGDTASSCPWCFMGHGFAYLTGDGGAAEGHGSKCPAFTPDGKLK